MADEPDEYRPRATYDQACLQQAVSPIDPPPPVEGGVLHVGTGKGPAEAEREAKDRDARLGPAGRRPVDTETVRLEAAAVARAEAQGKAAKPTRRAETVVADPGDDARKVERDRAHDAAELAARQTGRAGRQEKD